MQTSEVDLSFAEAERPISITRLVRTLQAYAPVILIGTGVVAALYAVVAILIAIRSPSEKLTAQPFRLEFDGATRGEYPNGSRFNPHDIVSTQALLKAYRENDLSRFTSFEAFARSVFILNANPEYEVAAAEYASRIADPKLAPVDRERLQKEWEAKKAAFARNDLSINLFRSKETGKIPETIARKVLTDVLRHWADQAINEIHVLDLGISIVSPDVVSLSDVSEREQVMALQVLRGRIGEALENIRKLSEVPGTALVRSSGGMSLNEIRLEFEDLLKYRVEALAQLTLGSGALNEPAITAAFLEAQLAYDLRRVRAAEERLQLLRDALAVYTQTDRGPILSTVNPNGAGRAGSAETRTSPGGETVMPQISDTFIDRLAQLTARSNDIDYRQTLVDELRESSEQLVPAREAVEYDRQMLAALRAGRAAQIGRPVLAGEIVRAKKDARRLIEHMNEIHKIISRNINPRGELYSVPAPALTRIERGFALRSLVLPGVAVCLAAMLLLTVLAFVHHHLQREAIAEAPAAEHSAGPVV